MPLKKTCPVCGYCWEGNAIPIFKCTNCGHSVSSMYDPWRKYEKSYYECSTCHHEYSVELVEGTAKQRWECPKCGCDCSGVERSSSEGCFITTACCEHKGLPDNCELLTTLRNYRDTYMIDNHPSDVETYYEISPLIVNSILKRKDAGIILDSTYAQLLNAKSLIDSNQLEQAYNTYRNIVLSLQKMVLCDCDRHVTS